MIDFKLKTDDELISSFVSGCNEAFDCLIERYDSEVLSYIRLSVADWDDANDIFQEVFIKVINTIREGRYQMQGKFRSWLLRIAHNAIIDYFRRAKAQKTISLSNDIYREDFIERIPCSSPNIEELLIANNTRQEVREWVAQLPKQQREVLILRFSQEMSFKEIAEYTGVSINTALGRMRYALINLRKIALKERAFAQ
ncbi:RNA polymerase sigma factor [Porphyromonas gingivicanis]|uniref:RNA polymerase sigma factor n=1 Tax=Porphyromonas gingivicanis TaxID=266762 RepID=UPI000472D935|nr:sigma-70 family RNA polymerase sigma factor [Porphyromonas gingivicanis]